MACAWGSWLNGSWVVRATPRRGGFLSFWISRPPVVAAARCGTPRAAPVVFLCRARVQCCVS